MFFFFPTQKKKKETPTTFKPPKTPREEPPFGFGFLKKSKRPKQTFGSINIYGRRFKKWKVIGKVRTEEQAFAYGKNWARKTLGVSFKFSPKVKARKLTGYRTKFEKGSAVYIEPRRRRLKKGGTEVREIQMFRGIKNPFKPIKKKKRKGKFDLW